MPKVSVVIPTLNRADLLSETLERIEKQTVSRDLYEVLVINNNSSDHTGTVLAQKSATYSNMKSFTQLKPGAAATRNLGIREALGDLVLFIDDDIFADSRLIEQHLRYHAENPNSSIVGKISSPWESSTDPFLRFLRRKGLFNPYCIEGDRPVDFSNYHTGNVSSSRKSLNQVGGFSEEFVVYGMEDIELGYRLERAGYSMVRGAEAIVSHEYYPTHEQFVSRCWQAGYSFGKLVDLHPQMRHRFAEKSRITALLKRFHPCYGFASTALNPLIRGLIRREQRRGPGDVGPALDLHYRWTIRYNFFLGYREFARLAKYGQTADTPLHGRQRMPKLAIERRD